MFGLSELRPDRGNDCPILRSISSCASGDMWSYLTRSFISPLPGYVENKAGDAENALAAPRDSLWSRPFPAATLIIPCDPLIPNSFCHAGKNFPKEKAEPKLMKTIFSQPNKVHHRSLFDACYKPYRL